MSKDRFTADRRVTRTVGAAVLGGLALLTMGASPASAGEGGPLIITATATCDSISGEVDWDSLTEGNGLVNGTVTFTVGAVVTQVTLSDVDDFNPPPMPFTQSGFTAGDTVVIDAEWFLVPDEFTLTGVTTVVIPECATTTTTSTSTTSTTTTTIVETTTTEAPAVTDAPSSTEAPLVPTVPPPVPSTLPSTGGRSASTGLAAAALLALGIAFIVGASRRRTA